MKKNGCSNSLFIGWIYINGLTKDNSLLVKKLFYNKFKFKSKID